MAAVPTIDISAYLDTSASKAGLTQVIEEVKSACSNYGFMQIKGHGVPLELQKEVIRSCKTFFALPQDEKNALSLMNSPSRRGYERIGEQTLDKKSLPDQKEGFYIGREVPAQDISFLRGPNQWPNLPEQDFHGPIMAYHKHMLNLCAAIMEVLILGLGHSIDVIRKFNSDPICNLKLLHYPKHTSADSRQFGAGAHTDFGCITVLLQQPGKHGLQVWNEPSKEWLPVPALEDVFVVNLGDLTHDWTDGKYRSTLHRVINAADGDRYSVPCFWEGALSATNPFKPDDTTGETVEDHVRAKYAASYGA